MLRGVHACCVLLMHVVVDNCLQAVAGHVYTKFSWGNMKSLWQDPVDKGLDVRQQLMNYYRWVASLPCCLMCRHLGCVKAA